MRTGARTGCGRPRPTGLVAFWCRMFCLFGIVLLAACSDQAAEAGLGAGETEADSELQLAPSGPVVDAGAGLRRPYANLSPEQFLDSLSEQELQLIREIDARGGLRAAVGLRSLAADQGGQDGFRSFQIGLYRAVAELLGLDASTEAVEIVDLIGIDGRIPDEVLGDPAYRYDPPLLENYDLGVVALTPLPWRMKLFRYVPILANQVFIVGRTQHQGLGADEMRKLRFAVPENSSFINSYEDFIDGYEEAPGLVVVGKNNDVLPMVRDGIVDATLIDGIEFLSQLREFPSLAPLEVASSHHYLGWITSRNSDLLAQVLAKAIGFLYQSGSYNRIFAESFPMDYLQYEKFIGLFPGQQIHELILSVEELNYIDRLRQGGALPIAVQNSPESYRVENGQVLGFDYGLAVDLAKILGLEPEIRLIDDVEDYFTRDGVYDPSVASDPSIRYTPDLFEQVEIFAAPFAVNEWRSRLLRFVPLHPAGIVLMGIDAENITNYQQLADSRIAVVSGGFQEQLTKDLMERHGFQAELVYYSESAEDVFSVLRSDRADYTIDGSLFIARGMEEGDEFTVSPLKLSVVTVAWAVAPENRILEGILRKFVDLSLSTGSFQKRFQEGLGVDFDFYLQLTE